VKPGIPGDIRIVLGGPVEEPLPGGGGVFVRTDAARFAVRLPDRVWSKARPVPSYIAVEGRTTGEAFGDAPVVVAESLILAVTVPAGTEPQP